MHYVYLLKSINTHKIYIGYTSNLRKRLKEHMLGKTYTTKRFLPIRCVYYEAYYCKTDAKLREKMLKQYGSSLQKLKSRIKNCLEGGAG